MFLIHMQNNAVMYNEVWCDVFLYH